MGEGGLILAKNEGLLPLAADTKKLNVFGWNSTNPVLGGTGSGSSDSSFIVGILQSLQDTGYETNQTLTVLYTEYCAERPTVSMNEQDWTLPEPTKEAYTDAIMKETKDFSEGRSSDLAAVTNPFEEYSRGDFVQLSRKDSFANYEEACAAPTQEQYEMSDETRKKVEESIFGIYDSAQYNDEADEMPVMGLTTA